MNSSKREQRARDVGGVHRSEIGGRFGHVSGGSLGWVMGGGPAPRTRIRSTQTVCPSLEDAPHPRFTARVKFVGRDWRKQPDS